MSSGTRTAMSARSVRPPVRPNLLLQRLPAADRARIEPGLARVTFDLGEVVQEVGKPLSAVYFPEGGTYSTLVTMSDGRAAETGNLGHDGFIGLAAFFGHKIAHSHVICQMPSQARAMAVDEFITEMDRGGAFRSVLTDCAFAITLQGFQTAACNRLHAGDQRLARWLLVSHDRAGTDRFPLTHDYLAYMLGVRRATVTELARALQLTRIIEYGRGVVNVLDRERLEKQCCECYWRIRQAFHAA